MQLQQAQSNQFDHHVHVEYEWRLRHDDLFDSDDDFEDKVSRDASVNPDGCRSSSLRISIQPVQGHRGMWGGLENIPAVTEKSGVIQGHWDNRMLTS